jgi:hypothetical protein
VIVDLAWLPKAAPKVVEVSKEGYRPQKLLLEGENQREVAAELAEVVEEIPLEVTVHPPGAVVEVDGTVGVAAPARVTLRWSVSLQSHTLRIARPGYVSKIVTVGREAARTPLEVRLAPSLPKSP